MKYYLIVGEASGDLHASHLMAALKAEDADASFRFFGGDLMKAVGGTMVKHYKELACIDAPTHHLCQHEAMQARHCSMATRCANPCRLSRLQSQHRKVYSSAHANTCLLLHLAQDMGVERVSHQEH